jgi:hypothetical protein
MLRVGFELTIPVFERSKTFHALERAATVFGLKFCPYQDSNSDPLALQSLYRLRYPGSKIVLCLIS